MELCHSFAQTTLLHALGQGQKTSRLGFETRYFSAEFIDTMAMCQTTVAQTGQCNTKAATTAEAMLQ